MTKHRARNRAIRERMARTGENFTTASRAMMDQQQKHDKQARKTKKNKEDK